MFDVPDAFEAWSVADFRRRRLEDASLLWVVTDTRIEVVGSTVANVGGLSALVTVDLHVRL
jgi:hypothetical protein